MTNTDALAYDEVVLSILITASLSDAVDERHVIYGRFSMTVQRDGVRIER